MIEDDDALDVAQERVYRQRRRQREARNREWRRGTTEEEVLHHDQIIDPFDVIDADEDNDQARVLRQPRRQREARNREWRQGITEEEVLHHDQIIDPFDVIDADDDDDQARVVLRQPRRQRNREAHHEMLEQQQARARVRRGLVTEEDVREWEREIMLPLQLLQQQARGARVNALEVHQAFRNIQIEPVRVIVTAAEATDSSPPIEASGAGVRAFFQEMLDRVVSGAADRAELQSKLNMIAGLRLTGPFFDHAKDPVELFLSAMRYARRQPLAFQRQYLIAFLQDCTTAYNFAIPENNVSCMGGIKERIVFSLGQGSNPEVILAVSPDQLAEYHRLGAALYPDNLVTKERMNAYFGSCYNLLSVSDNWEKTTPNEKLSLVEQCVRKELGAPPLSADTERLLRNILDESESVIVSGGKRRLPVRRRRTTTTTRPKSKSSTTKKNKNKNKNKKAHKSRGHVAAAAASRRRRRS